MAKKSSRVNELALRTSPEDEEPSEGAQAASPQTKIETKKPRIPERRLVSPSLAAARTALRLDEKDEQGLTNRQRLLAEPSAADKQEAQKAAEAVGEAAVDAVGEAKELESPPTGTYKGIGGDPWLYSIGADGGVTVFNTNSPQDGWKSLKEGSKSYNDIMQLLSEKSPRLVHSSDTLQDMSGAEVGPAVEDVVEAPVEAVAKVPKAPEVPAGAPPEVSTPPSPTLGLDAQQRIRDRAQAETLALERERQGLAPEEGALAQGEAPSTQGFALPSIAAARSAWKQYMGESEPEGGARSYPTDVSEQPRYSAGVKYY